MVSFKSALLVLAAATPATSKLWGWPESWEMVTQQTKSLWGEPIWKVCEGFGNHCNAKKCSGIQEWTSNGWLDMRNFSWAILKRKKSAWIDMWQINTVQYHLYESGKGHLGPQGICEVKDAVWWRRWCGNHVTTVKMKCWQF